MGSFCLDWCWLTKIRLRKSFLLGIYLETCSFTWRELEGIILVWFLKKSTYGKISINNNSLDENSSKYIYIYIYWGNLLIPQWSHFPNWSLLQDSLTPLAMKCQLQSIRGWEGKCAYLFSFFNAKSEGFCFKRDFVGPLRPKNNNGGRQAENRVLIYFKNCALHLRNTSSQQKTWHKRHIGFQQHHGQSAIFV